MEKTLMSFTNPLSENFTFRWDKVPYEVPAKTTITLPTHLAKHGAKKLTDYIILHPANWKDVCPKRKSDDLNQGREELMSIIYNGIPEPVAVKTEEIKEEAKEEVKEEEFSDLKNL